MKSLCGVFVLAGLVAVVWGHGYLMDPPGRASAWRYGFNTPINVDDNGIRCEGVAQNLFEDGKCGVCGDHYQVPSFFFE